MKIFLLMWGIHGTPGAQLQISSDSFLNLVPFGCSVWDS